MDLWNVLVFSKESYCVVDQHFKWSSRRWTGKVSTSRAFNLLVHSPPPQIHICVCYPHMQPAKAWIIPSVNLQRGPQKEFLKGILLHFIPPKLEYFSKKQLNQNYLQTDAIVALPTYLSLYRRGDSPLLKLFWSRIGFAKAWMAYLLSPSKFAPCISWRWVWLNRTKTAPDKITYKVPSVLTMKVCCPRFPSSEKPWKASKIWSNPVLSKWDLWDKKVELSSVCV